MGIQETESLKVSVIQVRMGARSSPKGFEQFLCQWESLFESEYSYQIRKRKQKFLLNYAKVDENKANVLL